MTSHEIRSFSVRIPVNRKVILHGDLHYCVPIESGAPKLQSMVIFAPGSGSTRNSPKNKRISEQLNNSGISTLLVDFFTPEEEQQDLHTKELRFNIPLLAERLTQVIKWVCDSPTRQEELDIDTSDLSIGIFALSTGTAAAIAAATSSSLPTPISAIVSRGGRPDLNEKLLPVLHCPTLLIVGGLDETILALNKMSFEKIPDTTAKQFYVVQGASHQFDEEGKLDEVAKVSVSWFSEYLLSCSIPPLLKENKITANQIRIVEPKMHV